MPGQLLPFRLLSSSGILRPFRLPLPPQNSPFPSNLRLINSSGDNSGARAISGCSVKVDFRAGRVSGRRESLIDDGVAVSDLKTDCSNLRPSSDLKTDSLLSIRNPSSSRGQRGCGSDGFHVVSEGRRSWSSVGTAGRSPMGSLLNRRSDSDFDGDSSTRERMGRESRGGIYPSSARKGGRDLESSYRQGQGMRRPVLAILEEEDDDDDGDSMSGFEDDFFGDKDDELQGTVKNASRSNWSPELAEGDSVQPASTSSLGEANSYLSQTRFDQCSLSPLSLKGMEAAGYERMTVVQEATLPAILKGKDVLAKAKTGTGKTVAFLLPAIEVVAKLPPVNRDQKRHPINVLVICPTRELAAQAAVEADTLLKYHPSIGVLVVTGGTRLPLEQKRMQANPCQIIVATPGRLRDHIENTPGFAKRLMGVKVLVLDEADRLLDMGFRKEIEKIVAAVPRQRQTLLFSATVPDEVRRVCYIAMKRDHEFINTVEDGSVETHSQVRQMHLVAPLDMHFTALYNILTEHISEEVDYKS